MKFKLVEDIQDRYLYHACNKIHNDENPFENYGEGFHFALDLEDLKQSMNNLYDKSIIVRYKLLDRLNPLKVSGDMD